MPATPSKIANLNSVVVFFQDTLIRVQVLFMSAIAVCITTISFNDTSTFSSAETFTVVSVISFAKCDMVSLCLNFFGHRL